MLLIGFTGLGLASVSPAIEAGVGNCGDSAPALGRLFSLRIFFINSLTSVARLATLVAAPG
jgi:hypothetical protein